VVVDGIPFVRYSADAVVVATPTGSTAYAFSAGGPVVSPRIEGLLVIPAAAHSAFNRALMLHHDERLVLELLPSSGRLAVEVDGNVLGHVAAGDSIGFDVDATAGRVVRLGRTTFYERARRKLHVSGSVEAF
jgi:NAD+ kinase